MHHFRKFSLIHFKIITRPPPPPPMARMLTSFTFQLLTSTVWELVTIIGSRTQFPPEHDISSVFSPEHSLPPLAGVGLLQSLDLDFWQFCPHVDHEVHSLHPPFTIEKIIIKFSGMILNIIKENAPGLLLLPVQSNVQVTRSISDSGQIFDSKCRVIISKTGTWSDTKIKCPP